MQVKGFPVNLGFCQRNGLKQQYFQLFLNYTHGTESSHRWFVLIAQIFPPLHYCWPRRCFSTTQNCFSLVKCKKMEKLKVTVAQIVGCWTWNLLLENPSLWAGQTNNGQIFSILSTIRIMSIKFISRPWIPKIRRCFGVKVCFRTLQSIQFHVELVWSLQICLLIGLLASPFAYFFFISLA